MQTNQAPSRRRFLLSSAAVVVSSRGYSLHAESDSPVAEIIRNYAHQNAYNGVILAGRKDQVVDLQCFGIANAEKGLPVCPQTRFEAGSISKWIASITVMKLIDQGKLSLDTPITSFLPEYRKDTGSQLTLAFLMSHSSGVPNQVIAALQKDRSIAEHEISQDEAVRVYASGDLLFKPGSQWDYSHSNWLIVKAILERVSGKPYATLVKETIVSPLHLRESGIFHGPSIDVPRMAQSYMTLLPQPEIKASILPAFLELAGGFYSTAGDMLRLMHGLTTREVLLTSSLRMLLTTRMPEQHYAFGGRIRTKTLNGQQHEVIWEDGSNRGFRMLAVRVRDDGRTVVMANNTSCDQPKMGDVAEKILGAL